MSMLDHGMLSWSQTDLSIMAKAWRMVGDG
jgi:hypothetical protein